MFKRGEGVRGWLRKMKGLSKEGKKDSWTQTTVWCLPEGSGGWWGSRSKEGINGDGKKT